MVTLSLPHVTKTKKNTKEETETNKRHCSAKYVQPESKIHESSPNIYTTPHLRPY